MDPLFASWLSGFIDGEGSFNILMTANRRLCSPRFTLKLRLDDAPLLEEIQAVTGWGRLNAQNTFANPQKVWSVNKKGEHLEMVALLDEYPLRSRKRVDFEIWREAVLVWNTEGQSPKLAALKAELEAARKYAPASPK